MAGLPYYKSPAVEAKKHIFLHCNASNLVLKILQHDKIWGDNPPLQILGDLSPVLPVIYVHAENVLWAAISVKLEPETAKLCQLYHMRQ